MHLKAISHLGIETTEGLQISPHTQTLRTDNTFFFGLFVVFLELSKLKRILCISQVPLFWMVFTKLGRILC